jgi:hypothetical protein
MLIIDVDRYSPLPHTAQRVRFLTAVQLPIPDLYNQRIVSSLDAYETLSSAFVRAVPGALAVSFSTKDEGSVNIDTHKLTAGIEGIQRLCKAFLSAVFLESALEGWGEDLVLSPVLCIIIAIDPLPKFFLDLWTSLHAQPCERWL